MGEGLLRDRATQDQDRRLLSLVAAGQRKSGALPPALRLNTIQLFELERMAAQRMNLAQIGIRLRIEAHRWEDIVEKNEDVRQAYLAGVARGMDVATGTVFGAMASGDVSAAKYYLDRQGGAEWAPRPQAPAVVVTGPQITIDAAGSVSDSLERQRKLLLEAEAEAESGSEAEAVKPEAKP